MSPAPHPVALPRAAAAAVCGGGEMRRHTAAAQRRAPGVSNTAAHDVHTACGDRQQQLLYGKLTYIQSATAPANNTYSQQQHQHQQQQQQQQQRWFAAGACSATATCAASSTLLSSAPDHHPGKAPGRPQSEANVARTCRRRQRPLRHSWHGYGARCGNCLTEQDTILQCGQHSCKAACCLVR